MTLNGVIVLILRFALSSIGLRANYITVVEDRPLMSAKYCLHFTVFHFWPKITHPAVRSLCNSWDTCWMCQDLTKLQPWVSSTWSSFFTDTGQAYKWSNDMALSLFCTSILHIRYFALVFVTRAVYFNIQLVNYFANKW